LSNITQKVHNGNIEKIEKADVVCG
jgi:hypothetical protein